MTLPITPVLLGLRAVVAGVASAGVMLARSPVGLAQAAPLPTPRGSVLERRTKLRMPFLYYLDIADGGGGELGATQRRTKAEQQHGAVSAGTYASAERKPPRVMAAMVRRMGVVRR